MDTDGRRRKDCETVTSLKIIIKKGAAKQFGFLCSTPSHSSHLIIKTHWRVNSAGAHSDNLVDVQRISISRRGDYFYRKCSPAWSLIRKRGRSCCAYGKILKHDVTKWIEAQKELRVPLIRCCPTQPVNVYNVVYWMLQQLHIFQQNKCADSREVI